MIKREIVNIKEKVFTKTYSDQNYYIYRNGFYYKEAYDLLSSQKYYEESNIPIK